MMRDASLRAFLEVGGELIKQFYKAEMRVEMLGGGEVLFRSADQPDRLRGANLSAVWLDEAAMMPPEVWNIVIGRLREAGRAGHCWITTTPRGIDNWVFERKDQMTLFAARTFDNPYLSDEFVQSLKQSYSSEFAKQELDGLFISLQGNVFKREWFKVVEFPAPGLRWVRYWDLAASVKQSADYTASVACALAPDGTLYLRDMIRGKWEWPDQEKIMRQTLLTERETVHGIEKAIHGLAALQTLLRVPELARVTIRGIDVDRDKLSRALPLSARAEQGKVCLVRGEWVPAFLDELAAFSGDGKTHDDQVDSASGGLAMLADPARSRKLVTY
jgi:predicted phage terminase large subunit-like protein